MSGDLWPELDTPAELRAYEAETRRLAEELWRYVFPPWRWPEWRRRQRKVKTRLAIANAARTRQRFRLPGSFP